MGVRYRKKVSSILYPRRIVEDLTRVYYLLRSEEEAGMGIMKISNFFSFFFSNLHQFKTTRTIWFLILIRLAS